MYELNYMNGKVCSIQKGLESIPICEGSIDYQEFLKWNSEQEIPLDLNSTIEPVRPEPNPNLITLKKYMVDPHSGLPDLETAFQALARLYLGE